MLQWRYPSTHATASAIDAARDASDASAAPSQPFDTAKPEVPAISSPESGGHISTGGFTISGTAEDDASVDVYEGSDRMLSSPVKVTSDGTWEIELTGVGEGERTYTATATDPAGNASGEVTVKVTVDTKKPITPSIDDLEDGADLQ